MRKQQSLRRAAEDLIRAADGDLQGPELDDLRERLADNLVLLEYRLRPKPSKLQLAGFAAGVTGAIGVGILLWRSRDGLLRQLRERDWSGPWVRKAIVTGREAVDRTAPPDAREVKGGLRAVGGDSRSPVETPARRA
jgi:hypothetical protein